MSTILIPSNTLRDAKRLFGKLKHLRCKLPVLNHLLLTAGQNGIHLAATDLDHWLETRVSDEGFEAARFLIPPGCDGRRLPRGQGQQVCRSRMRRQTLREIRLNHPSGGIRATSVYPTLDPSEFPDGRDTIGNVIDAAARHLGRAGERRGCASTDTTRQILNGVLFTPEDGGRLVATDGRRLACCPATVPAQSFVLPLAACHILGHPDFTAELAAVTWIDHKDRKTPSGHTLRTTPLVSNPWSATTRTTSR